jgi:hypothetical protein
MGGSKGLGVDFRIRIIAEPADEADRGRHTGFARHEGLAGGPGSLSLSFGHQSDGHQHVDDPCGGCPMYTGLLLASLVVGGTEDSSVAQPTYEFELRPKEIKIVVVKEKDRTVFLVTNLNVGEVTIKLKGGQWPDKVSLRFQDKDEKVKPGLEHIRITTDRLYVEGSHHLSGNFPFFFLDAKGKKPFEVIDDHRASGRLKIVVERRDGAVEVTLPTNLLAGSSQLNVSWIGCYTK